jgi:uncharacterized phage protein (TIGR01671 family)
MRKIKFRAWDKEKGMLHYDGIFNSPNFFDNSNLMQFTGLKDKNEKEIYEGDVVRIKGYSGGIEGDIDEIRLIKDIRQVWCQYDIDNAMEAGMDVEVMGNIYENPELLTNK